MYALDDLWHGKIIPFESPVREKDRYMKLLSELEKQEEKISALLPEEGVQLLEKYRDSQDAMSGLSSKHSFIDGFCLGARLMLDVLGGD